MSRTYILIGQTPVREPNMLKWAEWMQHIENRTVHRTNIYDKLISTVFLGLDHSFGFGGPPLLFETMVFSKGSCEDEICERCSTWLEAEKQHKAVVRLIKKTYGKKPR